MTKTAALRITGNRISIVDDDDYVRFSKTKWHLAGKGYAKSEKGYLHRLIIDAPAGVEVDHVNGDKLDNRRCNLRLVSSSENKWNRGKQNGSYSSRFKGVSWHAASQSWRAQIKVKRKLISLGYYPTEIDAARAYNAGALKHHGEFAFLNNV
jgi:hypothetical protein